MKKILTLLFVFILSLCFAACTANDETDQTEERKYIYFETSVINLYEEETFDLSIQKVNVTGDVQYQISDSNVAIIEDEKIVAKSVGQCVLTATVGEYTTKCNVIVSEYSQLRSITFDYSEKNSIVGEEFVIYVSTLNVDINNVEVLSSNNEVVTVEKSNDKIIAKSLKIGFADITAKVEGASAVCNVAVYSNKTQRLPKPEIEVDGNTISFTKSDIINGVYYRVNNSVWKKTDQAFTINTFIPVAQALLVEIKAYSNDMNYFESDIVKAQIYGELFVYGGTNIVSWKALSGATSYDVYVDGKLVSENQVECYYDKVNQDDFYQVKVVADNGTESNDCLYFRRASSSSKIYDMSKKPKMFNIKNHSGYYNQIDGEEVMTIDAALGWGWNRRYGIYVGNGKVVEGDKLYFYSMIDDFSLRVKTGEEGEGEDKKDIIEKVAIPHLSKYVSEIGQDIYSCGYHTNTSRRTNLIEGWVKNTIEIKNDFLEDTDGDGVSDTINLGYFSLFEYVRMKDSDGNDVDAEKLFNLIEEDIDTGLTTVENIGTHGWLEYKLHVRDIYIAKEPVNAITLDQAILEMSNNVTINDLKPSDYYVINALYEKYENISSEEKVSVINYGLLESYYQAYNEKYEVKVLFDGSDLSKLNVSYTYGTTIPSASLANAMVAEDDIVGNYLKATYTQTENNGYIVLTIDRSEVKDYDIHFQTKGVYDGTSSWSSDYLGARNNNIKWAYEPHHTGNWGTVWAYAPSGATQSACSANIWAHSYIEASALNSQDSIYLGISLYGLDDAYVCVSPIVAIKAK